MNDFSNPVLPKRRLPGFTLLVILREIPLGVIDKTKLLMALTAF